MDSDYFHYVCSYNRQLYHAQSLLGYSPQEYRGGGIGIKNGGINIDHTIRRKRRIAKTDQRRWGTIIAIVK